MRKAVIIMAAVAVMAASGGYFVAMVLNPGASPQPPAVLTAGEAFGAAEAANVLGQRRPDFVLTDTAGQPVSAERFDGQVMLLNFWATWCAPCKEEMPMLSQLQEDHRRRGLAVVGIALDDPDRARSFAEELGLSYPVLFGLPDAMVVGRRYGNRSGLLPYSVLVDGDGIIRWTRLGVLDRLQLETQLAALVPAEDTR